MSIDIIVSLSLAIATMVGTVVSVFQLFRGSRRAGQEAEAIRQRLATSGESSDHLVGVAEALREAMTRTADNQLASRLADIETDVERLRQRSEKDDRRYRLLQEYAIQGLSQSKLSFRVSLSAAGLGFVVVLVGVILAVAGRGLEVSLVPILAGAVVEAVALLFFAQDRRAQGTMSAFFDKLRDDRRMEDAIDLMREIEDQNLRGRLQVSLSLHFAGLKDAIPSLPDPALDMEPARLGSDRSPNGRSDLSGVIPANREPL